MEVAITSGGYLPYYQLRRGKYPSLATDGGDIAVFIYIAQVYHPMSERSEYKHNRANKLISQFTLSSAVEISEVSLWGAPEEVLYWNTLCFLRRM